MSARTRNSMTETQVLEIKLRQLRRSSGSSVQPSVLLQLAAISHRAKVTSSTGVAVATAVAADFTLTLDADQGAAITILDPAQVEFTNLGGAEYRFRFLPEIAGAMYRLKIVYAPGGNEGIVDPGEFQDVAVRI